jgi:hypothetical protein
MTVCGLHKKVKMELCYYTSNPYIVVIFVLVIYFYVLGSNLACTYLHTLSTRKIMPYLF